MIVFLGVGCIDCASVFLSRQARNLAQGTASIGMACGGLVAYGKFMKGLIGDEEQMPEWRKKTVIKALSTHLSAEKLNTLVFNENEKTSGHHTYSANGRPIIVMPTHSSYLKSFYRPDFNKFVLLHEAGHYQLDHIKKLALSKITLLSLGCFFCLKKGAWWKKLSMILGLNSIDTALGYRCESQADDFAINCLKKERDIKSLRAGIEFFKKAELELQEMKAQSPYLVPILVNVLDSHPSNESRIAKLQNAIDELK